MNILHILRRQCDPALWVHDTWHMRLILQQSEPSNFRSAECAFAFHSIYNWCRVTKRRL